MRRQPLRCVAITCGLHSSVLSCSSAAATGLTHLTKTVTSRRAFAAFTSVCHFDLRAYEIEKRRRRDLEKAGIDPDDDEPWIAPEEQQRIDEEDAARRAEEEELRKQFLSKRAEDDAIKRQRFKEFRARQIAISRNRKDASAEKKERRKQEAEVGEDVDIEQGGSDGGQREGDTNDGS